MVSISWDNVRIKVVGHQAKTLTPRDCEACMEGNVSGVTERRTGRPQDIDKAKVAEYLEWWTSDAPRHFTKELTANAKGPWATYPYENPF